MVHFDRLICQNVFRQEAKQEEKPGEHQCHPSAYNKETAAAVSLIT